jgi:hypothetical protein
MKVKKDDKVYQLTHKYSSFILSAQPHINVKNNQAAVKTDEPFCSTCFKVFSICSK